ncbi:hypothetical protein SAMN05216203_1497 [Marinobacter daqiaonensis]|uniref:N-acetyltransferase domain-containing protein n=1 Tax=Marinobacter daqiaonensis TaxID=650891 RepID=A0A1I6HSM8_9GAMM|nr:hypothetical protein [Marinobacter daqiaonensis]SFR57434.1 hypothetical protein SAMN05216203_1497 [Marinobacter daqiaonensis]
MAINLPNWLNLLEHGKDDLFRDLNDMESVLKETQQRIDDKSLSYEFMADDPTNGFFAVGDPHEELYTAVVFFELGGKQEVQTLVIFTNVNLMMPLRFTLGYAVAPKLRGQGRGLAAVNQSLEYFDRFLEKFGPSRRGEFTDQEVEVDVIVDQENLPSRKLAEKIRPAKCAWQAANEERSRRPCEFFSMPLKATQARKRRPSLFA